MKNKSHNAEKNLKGIACSLGQQVQFGVFSKFCGTFGRTILVTSGGVTKIIIKQAGTGPSRRHIQGSKIAKKLPSVKYSLLQYSKIENFSKKLHTQKNGPSGAPGPASASPLAP